MDQKIVDKLERDIAQAIKVVIHRPKRRKLPLQPTPTTMHLMAKAAVAVYEAAVETQDERGP